MPASAQDVPPVEASADDRLQAFLQSIRSRALAEGVRPATFDEAAASLTVDPRVVALDRQQPGASAVPSASPRFAPYRARHVDANRIARGRSAYARVRPLLAAAERRTGVPEAIAVSIWGHETDYGGFTGSFDLLRSLGTLAWDGRRRELFTAEYIDALKMIDRGVPRERLKGSWAGATGYPQFLPSVWLRLGTDGDGDGKADIWGSEADALASIGNYLLNAGWKPNVRWGALATVPDGFDRARLTTRLVSPRCPRVHQRMSRWLTLAEWRAEGVFPDNAGAFAPTELLTLIEPDGPGEPAYLLSNNYRVILDYNCSNYYALAVGLLADAVAG